MENIRDKITKEILELVLNESDKYHVIYLKLHKSTNVMRLRLKYHTHINVYDDFLSVEILYKIFDTEISSDKRIRNDFSYDYVIDQVIDLIEYIMLEIEDVIKKQSLNYDKLKEYITKL